MKKTGYSEIDAMFTTSSLSEELSVYVAFYNEYSNLEIKNLKNTYESFKDAKKNAWETLKRDYDKVVPKNSAVIKNFNNIAIYDLDLYGKIDARWEATSKTYNLRKAYSSRVEIKERFILNDLFYLHPYFFPKNTMTFEQWMYECKISESKENWRDLFEVMEKYRNSFFGRKTYERLLVHYKSRVKHIEKIIQILKPLYSDAANARFEVEEYKKRDDENLKIYNSKFDKRIKAMNAILNGVSLKHFLLECESEYNERPY